MWKRLVVAAAVALAGTSILAGRARADRAATRQEPATATLTGCLRQGSAAVVFILRGAQEAGQPAPPRDHLIVSPAQNVALAQHLNQRVAITGSSWRTGGPAAPAAANTVERALARIEARSLKVVADNCS